MGYGVSSRGVAINGTKKRKGRVGGLGWHTICMGVMKKSVRNVYRYRMMGR
jgi:hypothetical protein